MKSRSPKSDPSGTPYFIYFSMCTLVSLNWNIIDKYEMISSINITIKV